LERNKFKGGAFVININNNNNNRRKTFKTFEDELVKVLKEDDKTINNKEISNIYDIIEHYKEFDNDIIFIITNCDEILENDKKKFEISLIKMIDSIE